MNKKPCMYNDKQFEEMVDLIDEEFGERSDYVVHEFDSEYVHTDTMIVPQNDCTCFITVGMGAREMNSPPFLKRCELVMLAGKEIECCSEDAMLIAKELTRISKFPFREETWLGAGHTMDASKAFSERFGYDYFAFDRTTVSAQLSGIPDEITFLILIPIYKEERDWCVKNHTLALLRGLSKAYDGEQVLVDKKREMLLPEEVTDDEMTYYNMFCMGLDNEAAIKLINYLKEAYDKGIEITEEMLDQWLIQNK